MSNANAEYAPFALAKLERVPEQLRQLPIWMWWRAEPKPDGGKPAKVPYYSTGKKRGSTDTPADRKKLVTLAQLLDRPLEAGANGPTVALGLEPESGLIVSGTDLDESLRDGAIGPGAQRILAADAQVYCEVSPSGAGVKLFGTGDVGTTKTAGLEIYSGGRHFTVTGDRLQGDAVRLHDMAATAAAARELLAHHVKKVAKGSRNNTLYSFACALRYRNFDQEAAWRALQERNAECLPPLDERELREVFQNAWKHAPNYPLTDLGNAERLVAKHGEDLRHLEGGGWATYESHRWQLQGAESRVMVFMKDVVRGLYLEAASEAEDAQRRKINDHARASESRPRLDAAVAVATWQPEVTDSLANYDTQPHLLGLRNGVYDLDRQEFRPGCRDDRITLQAAVLFDPRARCPRWEQFQSEIHAGDESLVAFKQRAWGYTASGDTSEQVIFMPYGEGSNGKSKELAVMTTVLGDYARKIEPESLLVRDRKTASNDIARLRGARFAPTVEVEDGGRMAESLVKQLTGEDKLAARFLYQEYFEFQPTAKIWLATNHKPEVTGTDYAIWRRILLIPYGVKFEGAKRDPKLLDKLLAELPGILNWVIAGYAEWRRAGLQVPQVVLNETAAYRADMDRVGAFLRECTVKGKGVTKTSAMYYAYERWMKDNGMKPVASRKFHEKLERDHKLFWANGDSGRVYRDVLLLTDRYSHDHTRHDGGEPGAM